MRRNNDNRRQRWKGRDGRKMSMSQEVVRIEGSVP